MYKGSNSLQDEISGAAAGGRVLLIAEEEVMAEPLVGCEELWCFSSLSPVLLLLPVHLFSQFLGARWGTFIAGCGCCFLPLEVVQVNLMTKYILGTHDGGKEMELLDRGSVPFLCPCLCISVAIATALGVNSNELAVQGF